MRERAREQPSHPPPAQPWSWSIIRSVAQESTARVMSINRPRLAAQLRYHRTSAMSKLSNTLKALVNAEFARPGPTPASKLIRPLLEDSVQEAKAKDVGLHAWLAITVSLSRPLMNEWIFPDFFSLLDGHDLHHELARYPHGDF